MDENATIGELIRERRLAQGYSLGQLATKLGQTAAVVRNWEKGTENPDTMLLPGLADALSVEAGALESLMTSPEVREPEFAGTVPGSLPRGLEIEEESAPADLPPLAAAPAIKAEAEPAAAVPIEPEPMATGESAVSTEIVDEPEPAAIAEDEAERDLEPEAVVAETALDTEGPDEPRGETQPHPPESIEDAPTEAIAPPVSPEPLPTRRRAGVVTDSRPVAAQAPEVLGVSPYKVTNPFLAFFDPKKRWLYYVRAVLTVIVLLVLLRVFFWALVELWDAIQQVFDSFSSTDEIEAIVPEA